MQAERVLQHEVMLRLRPMPLLAISVPNSFWVPTRTPEEKTIVQRIVARMKSDGMLTPGAFDLAVFWGGGRGGMIELKVPSSRDLLGNRKQAGRPSKEQLEMAERAAKLNIHHAFCWGWDEVNRTLKEWGAI